MQGLFAVTPKKDCPHCVSENIMPKEDYKEQHVSDPCHSCGNIGENWICLTCKVSFCSRYVNGHMAEHNNQTKHPICFSFADFSYWCFECDAYLEHPLLDHSKYFYA